MRGGGLWAPPLRGMLCLSAALAVASVAADLPPLPAKGAGALDFPAAPSTFSTPPPATFRRPPLMLHPFLTPPSPPDDPSPHPQGDAPPVAGLDYEDAAGLPALLAEDQPPPPAGPLYFATGNSTTVTAQMGSTALVPCVVRNIGDGMVSWIRRKDYHLLTVGLTTYSSDERYSAVHAQHSEDWTLQIKYVQERDAGLYECQVSSHPPTSIFIDLRVVEARADILGPSEKYLKSGSTLRLSCVLRQSTEPPVFVFWYHNNRMINYDRDRGVNVTSPLAAEGGEAAEGGDAAEGGEGVALGPEEEHASTLVIASAQKVHSGNYSCVPNNAQPASTYVHILNGENPAAMQHGGRGLAWLRSPSAWLLAACLLASLSPSRPTRGQPQPRPGRRKVRAGDARQRRQRLLRAA
ncbi:limbic system-associated membrane protein-like isoform X2 [Hetaerina americana]|uniref:limbic system-associated membrane protein-like isoform X2 n=1 Tax=Hetaerina americana TaxID=62018 RepID=UPI003A7F40CC